MQGNSTNEVASKLMVAAYTNEFEISALDVFEEPAEVRFLTEVAPEDNIPGDTFHFPHIVTLMDGLKKKKSTVRSEDIRKELDPDAG